MFVTLLFLTFGALIFGTLGVIIAGSLHEPFLRKPHPLLVTVLTAGILIFTASAFTPFWNSKPPGMIYGALIIQGILCAACFVLRRRSSSRSMLNGLLIGLSFCIGICAFALPMMLLFISNDR